MPGICSVDRSVRSGEIGTADTDTGHARRQ